MYFSRHPIASQNTCYKPGGQESPEHIWETTVPTSYPTSLPVVTSLQDFENIRAYVLMFKDDEHSSLPNGHRGGTQNPHAGMPCFTKVSRERVSPEDLGPLMLPLVSVLEKDAGGSSPLFLQQPQGPPTHCSLRTGPSLPWCLPSMSTECPGKPY